MLVFKIKRKRGDKENSPKMRIFSLTKIDPGPEKQEIEEAEECGTRSINDNNINKTFDFIVLQSETTILNSAARCVLALYPTHPRTFSKVY